MHVVHTTQTIITGVILLAASGVVGYSIRLWLRHRE